MTVAEQREATVRTETRPDRVGAERVAPAPIGGAPRRWPTNLAIALVALTPFVAGAWSIVARGFPAGALFGDRALIGLATENAWRAPALLGAYSRFYWHHPGPLYFYVLNVLSVVFGGGTVGLVLGAVAINAAAAAGILALAFRRGGRFLLLWASLLLSLYLVAVEPIPFDIWNPSVTLIPFVLVLLLAWSVACRDWWAAPWLTLVASFEVQTHVGLAPGVAAALAFAVGAGVWRVRRSATPLDERARRALRRAVVVSSVVTVVVWLPPLVEQFTSDDGNLSALARFFSRPGSPHTLSEGLTNAGLQATLMVRSVFEPVNIRLDFHQGLAVALVLTAIAFVAAVAAAKVARASDTLVLLLLVAVELVVGVYAITRIVDAIQFYLVQWISAVGFVVWLGVGNAAYEFARTRWSGAVAWRSVARGAAIVLVAALCIAAVRAFPHDAGQMDRDLNVPNDRKLFGSVPSSQLLSVTRPGRTVVLRLDSTTAWEVMASDALLLEQHGRHVQIVETPVTRLLFDDSLRVDHASGAQVLAFRDRPHPRVTSGETFVANQGEWSIVDIDPR